MKYIFIVNESAGRGKSQKILPNIEAACQKRNIEYEIRKVSEEKNLDVEIIDQILDMLTILNKNEQEKILRRNVNGQY